MADLVFVATLVAFLTACVLYVRGCERLISSSEDDTSEVTS